MQPRGGSRWSDEALTYHYGDISYLGNALAGLINDSSMNVDPLWFRITSASVFEVLRLQWWYHEMQRPVLTPRGFFLRHKVTRDVSNSENKIESVTSKIRLLYVVKIASMTRAVLLPCFWVSRDVIGCWEVDGYSIANTSVLSPAYSSQRSCEDIVLNTVEKQTGMLSSW